MDRSHGLAEAVEELYAGAPEDFVATRKTLAAQARADADRLLATQITALRKPTVSAWALNVMARTRPDLMADLAEFSVAMRAAQAGLDAAAMRELSRGREELLNRLVEGVEVAAQEEDGRSLAAGLLAEVRATFVAAIADPQAQEAVASGCLTRALSYAGFGEVDLSQALAATGSIRRAAATPDTSPHISVLSEAVAEPDAARIGSDTHGREAASQAEDRRAAEERRETEERREDEKRRERERRAALARATDRLGAAEREVTALSLAHAEAIEAARRAADRRAELTRLLERATREARTAQDAATAAGESVAQAEAARDAAAAEVERLT